MVAPFSRRPVTALANLVALPLILATVALGCASTAARAPNTGGARYPTPEGAIQALAAAAKRGDTPAMLAIFGDEGREILASGDPVADRRARDVFVVAMEQKWALEEVDANRRELVIGHEQWPFPVPIVRDADGWRFDAEAGKREVLARRIGRNELAAIGICGVYVVAQEQYAAESRDGNPTGRYAQKFRSTPGRHDGLFWPTKVGEKHSPLGDLAARAAAEGYVSAAAPAAAPDQGPRALRGYFFRILTEQGPAAPGGAKSYLVDGQMTGGFAVVAYPAEYGNSGIMTFIVNQDGVVHEADLGPDTAKTAAAMTAYDPDGRFRPVD